MFKKALYYLLPVLLISTCFQALLSQNLVLKHYGVNEGLPSSECYWVTQDSRHMLWIGTDGGVVKYDGYKFITYTSSKGLPDNTVFKIHEDRHGRIWFACYSGAMAYYSYETDSIYSIPLNKKLSDETKLLPIDFCFDEKDTLWVSFKHSGYLKIIPPLYNSYTRSVPSVGFYIKEISEHDFVYGTQRLISRSYSFPLSSRRRLSPLNYTPYLPAKTGLIQFLLTLIPAQYLPLK